MMLCCCMVGLVQAYFTLAAPILKIGSDTWPGGIGSVR